VAADQVSVTERPAFAALVGDVPALTDVAAAPPALPAEAAPLKYAIRVPDRAPAATTTAATTSRRRRLLR
jgi:hypothetical protein